MEKTESRSRLPVSSPLGIVALLLAAALACSPAERPSPHELALADLVPTQAGNVSTDLVAVPEETGLDRVLFGWERERAKDASEAHLLLVQRIGQIELFSADGDPALLRLEVGLPPDWPESVEAAVVLNGTRIGRVVARPGWSTQDLEVPADVARTGRCFLELWTQPRQRRVGADHFPLRLRRLVVHSRSQRPLWPGRPGTITVQEGGDGGTDRTVEMPAASYAEVVLRVPRGGRISGELDGSPEGDAGGIAAYARLLDENLVEHSLVAESFTKQGSRRRFAVDLSPWTGRLARLRFGATGPGNGVVHWRRTAIGAEEPFDAPRLPPVDRVVPQRSARLGRPDVVLILLDAARADAFSPFGGPHPTPALERLAEKGTVFADALAPSSWTGQSVPAILTGHSPDALGVGGWGSRLPPGVPTLAELASASGYRTVLWSRHPFYWGEGLAERFDVARHAPDGNALAIPEAALLGGRERPTLALVHMIPPHAPYTPPAPFLGAYSSWYSGSQSVAPRALHRAARDEIGDEDVRYVHDRYLENAAFADHLVGQILDELERAGRLDRTLVVVLSDHGEAFMEHGRFLHTALIHREYVHVPLVVKWPSTLEGFAARVTEPVSLLDLVPTLVDGLDLGAAAGFMGRDLLPVVLDRGRRGGPIYSVTRGESDGKRAPFPRQMIQDGPWRLLYSAFPDQSLLYRADLDPDETSDLAADHAMQVLLMRQQVLAQSAWSHELVRGPGDGHVLEDPAVLEQLEALGYVN